MFCAISSFVTVFKTPSAAEASESVYLRERVKEQSSYFHIVFTSHQIPKKLSVTGKALTSGIHQTCGFKKSIFLTK